jgi:hypothetical protein
MYVGTTDGCYQLFGAGRASPVRRDIVLGKLISADHMLLAVDATAEIFDRAGIHVWTRTHTVDRWLAHTVG